jgi:hypothetical protein
MRLAVTVASLCLLLVAMAGCEPELGGRAPAHSALIIVREFTFSPGIVTLDPSFGFSLDRGAAGVPPSRRAASVGRAAAFSLADSITEHLVASGYDAIRSDSAAPEPGARALIVAGAFRQIDQGNRRRIGAENPSVAIDGEIDYQTPGAAPQRITELHLDSQRVPPDSVVEAPVGGRANANLAASRVGGAIARIVIETARLNNWPAASR